MGWLRKTWTAALFGGVLSTVGCCYHAEHFGKTRDIGLGEVGCGTCSRSRCGSQGAHCPPCGPACAPMPRHAHSDQGMPSNFAYHSSSVPIITAGQDAGDVSRVDFRSRNSSDLPVYVLPPDSVANALLVSPSPLPVIPPRQTRVTVNP